MLMLPDGKIIRVTEVYACKVCLKPILVIGDKGWATLDNPECKEHDRLLMEIEEYLKKIGAEYEVVE